LDELKKSFFPYIPFIIVFVISFSKKKKEYTFETPSFAKILSSPSFFQKLREVLFFTND
jgi:hypothetical protein